MRRAKSAIATVTVVEDGGAQGSRRRHPSPPASEGLAPLRGHSGTLAQARFARIASVTEARLEDAGSGLAPATEGWFVVEQGEPA